MEFSFSHHLLTFKKPAKTSRGEYIEKPSWLLQLSENHKIGVGEASPLSDLSLDGTIDFHSVLENLPNQLSSSDIAHFLESWKPGGSEAMPAMRFALHCAYLDLINQGNGTWINSSFTRYEKGIPINGLVWMNEIDAMEEEAKQKVECGFRCIKFKVGALDFDDECRLLERIRKVYSSNKLEIRLDANGAFESDTALQQIKELNRFEIHSIEQPIKPGQDFLEKICAESKIDVALDEELIGLSIESGKKLIRRCKPKYIILKPSLLGGIDLCDEWIKIAQDNKIGWWATSALEGNIGLYAISQWVSKYENNTYQGLGTGSLFIENFPPKTVVKGEDLWRI